MRRDISAFALLVAVTGISAPVFATDINHITAVTVEEGPNNTVVSLVGDKTPTFTVFKLLDPVRVVIDVMEGNLSLDSNSLQVRNGVVHDIESIQFQNEERSVTRVVIGFDQEASYNVKADNHTIRIVIDGTDRQAITNDARTAEALQRADRAIAAEQQLRTQLETSTERALAYKAAEESARNEQSRLQGELQAVREQMRGLRDRLTAQQSETTLRQEESRAEARDRAAIAEQARVAAQRLEAIQQQTAALQREQEAAQTALAATERRRTALQAALQLEEQRRTDAERARRQEEALTRTAQITRQAEEARIAQAQRVVQTEAQRSQALDTLRTEADNLREQAERGQNEITRLRTQLEQAQQSQGDAARQAVAVLQAQLQEKEAQHASEKTGLNDALEAAQTAAVSAERAHQEALIRLEAAEGTATHQVAQQQRQLQAKEDALKALQDTLTSRDNALRELRTRDEERVSAQGTLQNLRELRVTAQQRVRDLETQRAQLESRVAALANQRQALRTAIETGRTAAENADEQVRETEAVSQLLETRRAEVERITAALEAAKQQREQATVARAREEQAVANVQSQLAREKEDLAAVLQQRELFAQEIAALRAQSAQEQQNYERIRRNVQQVSEQVSALFTRRTNEEERVKSLEERISALRTQYQDSSDRATLNRLLTERTQEVERLQHEVAQQQRERAALSQQSTDGQEQLTEALERARAEAQRSAEGRERLRQLESYIENQRAQIERLQNNDHEAELETAQKNLATVQTQLDALTANNEEQLNLSRVRDRTLRRELRTARGESRTTQRSLRRLERQLEQRQGALTRLEAQLAQQQQEQQATETALRARLSQTEQTLHQVQQDTDNANQELAVAKTQIETMVRQKNTAVREVERLEQALQDAARTEQVAGLREELATARRTRQQLETALANEQTARVADEQNTAARVQRLEQEKGRLLNRIQTQEAALAQANSQDGDIQRLETERAHLNQALSTTREQVAELTRRLETARTDAGAAAELAATLTELNQVREEALAQTQRLEGELAGAQRQVTAVQARVAQLEQDKRTATQEVSRLEHALSSAVDAGTESTALRQELDRARAEQARLTTRLGQERQQHQTERAQAQREVATTQQELNTVQTRVQQLTEAHQKALQTVSELEGRLAQRQANSESEGELHNELAAARAETQRLAADLERQHATHRNELVRAQADTTAANQRLQEARARIGQLTNDNSLATNEVSRLERALATATSNGLSAGPLRNELMQARQEQQRLAAALTQERQRRERELRAAETRVRTLIDAREALNRQVTEAKAEIATLQANEASNQDEALVNELRARLARKEQRIERLATQLQTARANQGAATELNQALQAAEAARTELESAHAQIARLEHEKRQGTQNIARLEQELTEARASGARTDALETQLAAARSAQTTAEEELSIQRQQTASRNTQNRTSGASSDLSRITNVAFREQGSTSFIEIDLDKASEFEIVEQTSEQAVLLVSGARLPRLLERRLDTRDFYGPIQMVSSFNDPDQDDRVRIVVNLNGSVPSQIARNGNKLVWAFPNTDAPQAGSQLANRDRDNTSQTLSLTSPDGTEIRYEPTAVGSSHTSGRTQPPPAGGTAARGGGIDFGVLNPFPRQRRARRYTGQRINLTIKDADIQQVLTFLAREGGVNIIAGENVSGNVTLHLKEVPWDLALDMILRSKGLDYVVEEGVYRVAPVEVIAQEFEQELEKRKQLAELQALVVKLVTVNYAEAADLESRVKDILSEKGTVSTDERTNTLIIKDIEEHVIAAEDLVRRLDTQTPQVLIEARIVEASTNFSEEFGIQWGGNYTASPAFGNETGLMFPGIIGISGAADDANAPTTGLLSDTPGFAVNLPAAVGGGSGGGLGLTLGSLSGAGNISLRLGAAEERGTVKIISSPRIATLDNNEATISQGISIPVSVVSSLGVNTQFFNAELSLKVTPHVTQDGNVSLAIQISKNEPNFSQTGASGNPTIERKEAQTQLLVRDGDTAVIGGIYTRNTSRSFKKVPILGDIPFLGWIFKSTVENDKRTELILFITPRIINRAASRVRVD